MKSIELKNVSIDYPLNYSDGYSLKARLFSLLTSKKKEPTVRFYRALDDISLTISQGEKVGIIGLNGAGKSTLLRVISGIFKPSHGEIVVRGKVSPLLDFATGFEEHHTGIENIRIRMMFLGESQDAINKKITEIAEFSELGEFLYRPVRTYSSGMFIRLAFAASTAISPEILVADEVIGAGDIQFASKARERVNELLSRNITTVLSSHSMALIRQFCKRVIWLDKGVIVNDGGTESIIKEYELWAQKL